VAASEASVTGGLTELLSDFDFFFGAEGMAAL
jgi:hypothetical protein